MPGDHRFAAIIMRVAGSSSSCNLGPAAVETLRMPLSTSVAFISGDERSFVEKLA